MKYLFFLIVVCPLIGSGLYIWKGDEIVDYFSKNVSADRPTSKVSAYFFKLPKEKQNRIRALYSHAVEAGRDKNYSAAFNDIAQIHKMVPFYKRSKILQSFAYSKLLMQAKRNKLSAKSRNISSEKTEPAKKPEAPTQK